MRINSFSIGNLQIQNRIKNSSHFLKKLEGVIDWNKFDNILSQTDYRNTNVVGRDCFSPMTMFRIMIIKVYYNLSNREMENELYCNLMYSYFCQLSFDSNIPDHSTICQWEESF